MHGAGGPVHVHSVLLVEIFLPISCLVAKFYTLFLVFQAKHMCGYSKNRLNESTQNTC